jgi:hypothetical protein
MLMLCHIPFDHLAIDEIAVGMIHRREVFVDGNQRPNHGHVVAFSLSHNLLLKSGGVNTI